MTQQSTAAPAPQPEDLHCEYAAAEVHVATLTSVVMQSAAIVVGGSIAALAFLINVEFTCSVAAAVTALGAGAVVVIAVWRYNWSRHKVFIDNCWIRMRQIEGNRGMHRNIDLHRLAQGRDKSEEPKEETYKPFPEPPAGEVVKLLHKIWGKLRSRAPRQLLGEIWDWLKSKLLSLRPRLPHSGQDVLQGTAWLVQVGWALMIAFAWFEAVRNQGGAPGCLGWATW